MSYVKALWAKVPKSWQDRLIGAAGAGATYYGGPAGKDLAVALWACVKAHYGL
jgi:hypothetical protein